MDNWQNAKPTPLENGCYSNNLHLTDDAIAAKLYMTKCSTISLYLMKLCNTVAS